MASPLAASITILTNSNGAPTSTVTFTPTSPGALYSPSLAKEPTSSPVNPGASAASSTSAAASSSSLSSLLSSSSTPASPASSSALTNPSGDQSHSGRNSSTVAVSPPSPAKKGISDGAVAGAAVGSLVGGILLGLLAMLVLCNRRNRKRTRAGHHASGPIQTTDGVHEKQSAVESLNLPSHSAAAVIERNLQDPISDAHLKAEYIKINQKINDHVLSYYRSGTAPADGAAGRSISYLLGPKSVISASQVTELLNNTQTRPNLLRYAIARVLISRIDIDSAPESSLLPVEVAHSMSALPRAQHNDNVRMAFFTKWKAMTSHMLGKFTGPSAESVHKAVSDCNAIIGPYASQQAGDTERLRNLEQIIRRAAKVSELLFTQPAVWSFDWQQPSSGLVVFPGLNKVVDENGRHIQPPTVFEPKDIVYL